MAYLVFKIIRGIQEDTLKGTVFWENLEIEVKSHYWEDVILREAKIAKPYGDITGEVLKKHDTGLKTKV